MAAPRPPSGSADQRATAIAASARVLVTRPRSEAGPWMERLREAGLDAVQVPLLAIGPPADPAAVQAAAADLDEQAAVMFASPTAVARWFAQVPDWPHAVLACATGPGTVQALRRRGVPGGLIVAPPAAGGRFDSEALWSVLQPLRDWRGAQVLVVRGEGGRPWLSTEWAAAGARVRSVAAYRRERPSWQAEERDAALAALAEPQRHWWLLSSSEAAGHLQALLPQAQWPQQRALATHPRIAEAALTLGFGRVLQVQPDPQQMALALRAEGQ